MGFSGHCLCGQTTFQVDVPSLDTVGYDHCDDCQRQSGSSYSLVCVAPRDKVTIKGPTGDYAKKGDSGKDVHRIFCSVCGSPIAHAPEAAKDIIAIKAGCFDTDVKKTLKPSVEIYTRAKLPFVQEKLAHPFDGMPQ